MSLVEAKETDNTSKSTILPRETSKGIQLCTLYTYIMQPNIMCVYGVVLPVAEQERGSIEEWRGGVSERE